MTDCLIKQRIIHYKCYIDGLVPSEVVGGSIQETSTHFSLKFER